MFAQVLTDWLTSITALVASIAAVAAVLNLWYNALSGPVIKLVGKPDFNLHDVPDNAAAIPMTVGLSPSFVFVNSGSTTGMIKLRLSFSPSPALQALNCCNRLTVAFENERGAQTKDMQHLFLEERESGIVKAKLFIELGDWKSYVPQSGETNSDIIYTLLKADEGNKERYHNFCKLLKNTRCLGTLSVYSTKTRRRWAKSRRIIKREDVIDDTPLFIEEPIGIDDESIQNLTRYYDNWNYVQPRHFVELFREVEQQFERFFSTEPTDRCQMLSRQINKNEGTLQTWLELWDSAWYIATDDRTREMQRRTSPMRYILAFILKSSELESKMREFSTKAEAFNRKRQLWNRVQKESSTLSSDLAKSIEEQRQELIAKNTQIQQTGDWVTDILKNCVATLLSFQGREEER